MRTALVAAWTDDIFERLAVEVAADLGGSEAEGSVDEVGGGACDVGGDEGVGGGPEGVCGGEGFGIGDVESGADVAVVEGFDEGVGLDDGAAGGVDEESSWGRRASSGAPRRPRVSEVRGTIRTTMSALGRRAWRSAMGWTWRAGWPGVMGGRVRAERARRRMSTPKGARRDSMAAPMEP